MFSWDRSSWPVVTITLSQDLSINDVEQYLAAFDECLASQQLFCAVMDYRELTSSNVGAFEHMTWADRNRDAMRARCRGVAYVLPSEEQVVAANGTNAATGEKAWGCPLWAGTGIDDAVAWAKGQLSGVPPPEP